jgi:hypothetical protein
MPPFDFQRLVEIALSPAPPPPGFLEAVRALSAPERLMLAEGIRKSVLGPDYASQRMERRITAVTRAR